MSHAKFKICPVCEERNPPARLECLKCETDLTGIKVVDEASLLIGEDAVPCCAPDNSARNELVKRCDCGAVNLPQARKCSACGEDISDIRPAPPQATNVAKRLSLHTIDESYSFVLEKPVTIIGREAEMKDYLSGKAYVSRQHAKFTITCGDVYIDNMSATNYTFVNNSLIPSDAPTLLENGDEIGIGGKLVNGTRQNEAAYFIFEATP